MKNVLFVWKYKYTYKMQEEWIVDEMWFLIIYSLFVPAEMQEAEDSIQKINSTRNDTETSNSKPYFSFWGRKSEVMFALVSMPVV